MSSSGRHILEFGSTSSEHTLVVCASGPKKWKAYYKSSPSTAMHAPLSGILAYLKLLFMSKRAPFDGKIGCFWAMWYLVDGQPVISDGGRAAYNNSWEEGLETDSYRIARFIHAATSGLDLLDCNAEMVDDGDKGEKE